MRPQNTCSSSNLYILLLTERLPDLYALAAWLTACRIETVAMESTGVY
jgi:hypothetical protein